jgi:4-amino-4-deoxy-L-arabinose transferase-like glycosyltransferase
MLWVVFVTAAVSRMGYVLAGFDVPLQDTADYDEIARNLLNGAGFVARENWFGYELHSWRAPLYPFFLAGVYGLFGYSHLAVQLVQVLIGAVTAALVYALGRKIHPPSAATAGLVAAVYGPLVASANEVMSETLFTFCLLLPVYLLSPAQDAGGTTAWQADRSRGKRDRYRFLAVGIAIGVAALARPVALILWPVAALWELRRRRMAHPPSPPLTWPVLWLSLGVVVALAPWTVRNWQVHGSLVTVSTHGGFIIARSNSADPDWRKADGWRIERSTFEETPSETERDRQWLHQGLSFVASNPGLYLRLAGERFLRFWYFLQPAYNIWFAGLFPFFALGLWRYWNRGSFALPGWLILSSTAVFCFVLYGSTRFRLPLEPFFILFAAAFFHDCWRTRGPVVTAAATAAIATLNGLFWWQSDALRQVVLQCLTSMGLR